MTQYNDFNVAFDTFRAETYPVRYATTEYNSSPYNGRFEAKQHVDVKGNPIYVVWDNYEHRLALRFDCKPAIYFASEKMEWNDAKQWAFNRARHLNEKGYVMDETLFIQNGRGKPRKDPSKPFSEKYNNRSKPTPSNNTPKETPKVETPEVEVIEDDDFDFDSLKPTTEEALNKAIAAVEAPTSQEVKDQIKAMIDAAGIAVIKDMTEAIEIEKMLLKEEVERLTEELQKKREIVIVKDDKKFELKHRAHKTFEKLLRVIRTKHCIPYLVGSAGTGKTTAAEHVAEALEVPFYFMSVNNQSSKADIVGFISPNGTYQGTSFREAYENGGVFLLDEVDAGNANVLMILNAGFANGSMAFPDKIVKRHPEFKPMAAANTYGSGASKQYVGTNKLNDATLDRFVMVDWDIDEDLEFSFVEQLPQGKAWHEVVKAMRNKVQTNNWLIMVSPRATQKGAHLLLSGFDIQEVLDMTVLCNVGDLTNKNILRDIALTTWNNYNLNN